MQPASAIVVQAESLIKSLKGVRDAQVHTDAQGRVTRVDVVTADGDERAATRNVQSALIAAFGITIDAGALNFRSTLESPAAQLPFTIADAVRTAPQAEAGGAQVLEISGAARRADLNVAARAAFDTLRAAQSSFHGFVFDGAELVGINGGQYIVVAVRRSTTEARYCGAAPVLESVSDASARALMNAVGVAAMGGAPAFEILAGEEPPQALKA